MNVTMKHPFQAFTDSGSRALTISHRRRLPPAASLLVAVLLVAAACIGPAAAGRAPAARCELGDTTMVRDVLYFGRNTVGGAELSDTTWQRFVDEVVSPRFPAGLTVWDAAGQWRGQSGFIERERSKVLTVLHPGDSAASGAVDAIAAEYKRRYAQESVLRERVLTCSRF